MLKPSLSAFAVCFISLLYHRSIKATMRPVYQPPNSPRANVSSADSAQRRPNRPLRSALFDDVDAPPEIEVITIEDSPPPPPLPPPNVPLIPGSSGTVNRHASLEYLLLEDDNYSQSNFLQPSSSMSSSTWRNDFPQMQRSPSKRFTTESNQNVPLKRQKMNKNDMLDRSRSRDHVERRWSGFSNEDFVHRLNDSSFFRKSHESYWQNVKTHYEVENNKIKQLKERFEKVQKSAELDLSRHNEYSDDSHASVEVAPSSEDSAAPASHGSFHYDEDDLLYLEEPHSFEDRFDNPHYYESARVPETPKLNPVNEVEVDPNRFAEKVVDHEYIAAEQRLVDCILRRRQANNEGIAKDVNKLMSDMLDKVAPRNPPTHQNPNYNVSNEKKKPAQSVGPSKEIVQPVVFAPQHFSVEAVTNYSNPAYPFIQGSDPRLLGLLGTIPTPLEAVRNIPLPQPTPFDAFLAPKFSDILAHFRVRSVSELTSLPAFWVSPFQKVTPKMRERFYAFCVSEKTLETYRHLLTSLNPNLPHPYMFNIFTANNLRLAMNYLNAPEECDICFKRFTLGHLFSFKHFHKYAMIGGPGAPPFTVEILSNYKTF